MDNLSPSQIETILFDVLPRDSELAGDAHVASVAAEVARGETVRPQPPSREGQRISPEAAMLAVAAAANFIKVCIEIYFTLKNARGSAPSQKEFTEKAVTQGAGVGESAVKLAAAVYKALYSA
jgi:hypothetical protein